MNHDYSLSERNHTIDGLFVKELSREGTELNRYPLLMIHGGSHGWWAFDGWLRFFAGAGWKSYSMSLRNHTDSYAVSKEEYLALTVRDYVDDVMRVIEQIEPHPVLIGHSMGGIIAQKAAEVAGIAALVLVSTVGPGQLGRMRGPVPVDRPVMLEMEDVKTLWFNRIADEELEAYYRRMVPESPSVINEYSSGKVLIDRRKIHCPVLVVGAQYDRTVVHNAKDVARFYDAPCITIPNSGHDVMLERVASEAADRIEKWLATLLRDSGDSE